MPDHNRIHKPLPTGATLNQRPSHFQEVPDTPTLMTSNSIDQTQSQVQTHFIQNVRNSCSSSIIQRPIRDFDEGEKRFSTQITRMPLNPPAPVIRDGELIQSEQGIELSWSGGKYSGKAREITNDFSAEYFVPMSNGVPDSQYSGSKENTPDGGNECNGDAVHEREGDNDGHDEDEDEGEGEGDLSSAAATSATANEHEIINDEDIFEGSENDNEVQVEFIFSDEICLPKLHHGFDDDWVPQQIKQLAKAREGGRVVSAGTRRKLRKSKRKISKKAHFHHQPIDDDDDDDDDEGNEESQVKTYAKAPQKGRVYALVWRAGTNGTGTPDSALGEDEVSVFKHEKHSESTKSSGPKIPNETVSDESETEEEIMTSIATNNAFEMLSGEVDDLMKLQAETIEELRYLIPQGSYVVPSQSNVENPPSDPAKAVPRSTNMHPQQHNLDMNFRSLSNNHLYAHRPPNLGPPRQNAALFNHMQAFRSSGSYPASLQQSQRHSILGKEQASQRSSSDQASDKTRMSIKVASIPSSSPGSRQLSMFSPIHDLVNHQATHPPSSDQQQVASHSLPGPSKAPNKTIEKGVLIEVDPNTGKERLILEDTRKKPNYEASLFVAEIPVLNFLSEEDYRRILRFHFEKFGIVQKIKMFLEPQQLKFNAFITFEGPETVGKVLESELGSRLVLPTSVTSYNRHNYAFRISPYSQTEKGMYTTQLRLERALGERTLWINTSRSPLFGKCPEMSSKRNTYLPTRVSFQSYLQELNGTDAIGRPKFKVLTQIVLHPSVMRQSELWREVNLRGNREIWGKETTTLVLPKCLSEEEIVTKLCSVFGPLEKVSPYSKDPTLGGFLVTFRDRDSACAASQQLRCLYGVLAYPSDRPPILGHIPHPVAVPRAGMVVATQETQQAVPSLENSTRPSVSTYQTEPPTQRSDKAQFFSGQPKLMIRDLIPVPVANPQLQKQASKEKIGHNAGLAHGSGVSTQEVSVVSTKVPISVEESSTASDPASLSIKSPSVRAKKRTGSLGIVRKSGVDLPAGGHFNIKVRGISCSDETANALRARYREYGRVTNVRFSEDMSGHPEAVVTLATSNAASMAALQEDGKILLGKIQSVKLLDMSELVFQVHDELQTSPKTSDITSANGSPSTQATQILPMTLTAAASIVSLSNGHQKSSLKVHAETSQSSTQDEHIEIIHFTTSTGQNENQTHHQLGKAREEVPFGDVARGKETDSSCPPRTIQPKDDHTSIQPKTKIDPMPPWTDTTAQAGDIQPLPRHSGPNRIPDIPHHQTKDGLVGVFLNEDELGHQGFQINNGVSQSKKSSDDCDAMAQKRGKKSDRKRSLSVGPSPSTSHVSFTPDHAAFIQKPTPSSSSSATGLDFFLGHTPPLFSEPQPSNLIPNTWYLPSTPPQFASISRDETARLQFHNQPQLHAVPISAGHPYPFMPPQQDSPPMEDQVSFQSLPHATQFFVPNVTYGDAEYYHTMHISPTPMLDPTCGPFCGNGMPRPQFFHQQQQQPHHHHHQHSGMINGYGNPIMQIPLYPTVPVAFQGQQAYSWYPTTPAQRPEQIRDRQSRL